MRPQLHLTAPQNWMNDPNGLIYYQGMYHIFYQHFPYTCEWGTMHWGHAVSRDLIHYEHLPIALYPSKYYDRNGCFSGSAIEYQGKMYLYYTAIRYAKENPEYIHVQYSDDDLIASQAVVISEDGYHFDNRDCKHLVVDVIKDQNLGDVRHTRDPKVWIGHDGYIYMGVGSKVSNGCGYDGEVLFYKSVDGVHFTYQNRFIDSSIGDMWECPDILTIDKQDYMIFSPENIDVAPRPNSNAVIMPVAFDEKTCSLTKLDTYMYLDYGLDFYAPQTFVDEYKNRVMFGWLRMRKPVEGENWCGMLTMPRVLTQKDGHIYQQVHPHIQKLFNQKTDTIDFDEPFLMRISMLENEDVFLGGLHLYIQDDCLWCNREAISIHEDKVCNLTHTPPLNQRYDLEIYYDGQVFEIFINDGYYVLSQIVYKIIKEQTKIKNIELYKLSKIQ